MIARAIVFPMTTYVFANNHNFLGHAGDPNELHIAAQLGVVVADWIGISTEDVFIADHEHEQVNVGCGTVTIEGVDGDVPWTIEFCDTNEAKRLRDSGMLFEPADSWTMTVWAVD